MPSRCSEQAPARGRRGARARRRRPSAWSRVLGASRGARATSCCGIRRSSRVLAAAADAAAGADDARATLLAARRRRRRRRRRTRRLEPPSACATARLLAGSPRATSRSPTRSTAVDARRRRASPTSPARRSTPRSPSPAARRAPSEPRPGRFPAAEVAATRLAVIGMGKAGARELNYVSDVDVIFVAESADEDVVATPRALDIATRLAMLTMRGIHEPGIEPPLWEVDANLRPEGKDGALVRTLDSHLAVLRPLGEELGVPGAAEGAAARRRPRAGRALRRRRRAEGVVERRAATDFVESVQRMRERVTEHIPRRRGRRAAEARPRRPARHRVHRAAAAARARRRRTTRSASAGTLPALAALAEHGYIGREEAAEFARDYRFLRAARAPAPARAACAART